MLSCLSCQGSVQTSKRWANRHWKFVPGMLTRRVVTICAWFYCFWVLVEFELNHHRNWRLMRNHVPGPTRLGKMSKPLLSSRFRFWKPCSGNSGNCHVWKLATEPSHYSADGSSAADISPSGFSGAGLWKAPLDGLLTRVPRERWQLLALRCHLSSVLVSPSCQRATVLVHVVTHSAALV